MNEQQHNLCGQLSAYLVGDVTDPERAEYERHLGECSACRQELEELREMWDTLPLLAEPVEVPADLKAQVFSGIFGAEPPISPSPRRSPLRRYVYWAGGLVASLLVVWLAGSLWTPFSGTRTKEPQLADAGPAQVVRTLELKPTTNAKPETCGTAWFTKRDGTNVVVVQLRGLAPTEGEQAYQVWLLHDGKRTNGGTLVASAGGEAVLTYQVREGDPPFEGIGVTLEPDSKGTQPRGPKILGST